MRGKDRNKGSVFPCEFYVQITGVIGAVGSAIAYILAEGYADSVNSGGDNADANKTE
ncbi:hypothetical protein FHR92_002953 [Fontibacillus solani]|uniref:Uncharacterized protein n=1 Tax=Fontibacillus solani TaxID=1572857 RepID=A0A7W3SUH2_9BACL|nr:hypothetical protein [Fontibacillus solani]MBA9086475.1 hypothetical protein [Fontibacillus solani]